jgi:hypothetical protein
MVRKPKKPVISEVQLSQADLPGMALIADMARLPLGSNERKAVVRNLLEIRTAYVLCHNNTGATERMAAARLLAEIAGLIGKPALASSDARSQAEMTASQLDQAIAAQIAAQDEV